MTSESLILDSNLLLLFVVGRTSPGLIARHKRLRSYSARDYELLVKKMASFREVLVNPNTLTETANLIPYVREPARTRIMTVFREIVNVLTERFLPSREATHATEFLRLGLTDAVLLELNTASHTLMTADVDLYVASNKRRQGSAVNFHHLRERMWQ